MPTKIEWCHETWNPITGCSAISEGCKNCYARRMANRLRGRYGYPKDDPFKVTFHPDRLDQPSKWKKPRMVFVCSMGDLFHDDVPLHWIDDIFQIIAESIHTFLILTKRPHNMKNYCRIYVQDEIILPENIWFGVTIEDQKYIDRMFDLFWIVGNNRFVSLEPLLGKIEFPFLRSNILRPHIDWVIAGPETGPGKRECKPEWIRDLYEQCQAAGIPFFDKSKHNWIAREFPNG